MKVNLSPPDLTEAEIARFFERVDKSPGQGPTGECWEWTRGKTTKRYGVYSPKHGGRNYLANRLAFYCAFGVWSELFVLHRCDNPPCCNPAHLFLGTNRDNALDAQSKGRLATGNRNGTHTHPEKVARGDQSSARLYPESLPRGSNHANAKLTEADVLAIREERERTGAAYRVIAEKRGIDKTLVGQIVRRELWTHI